MPIATTTSNTMQVQGDRSRWASAELVVHRIEIVAPAPTGQRAVPRNHGGHVASRCRRRISRSLFSTKAPPLAAMLILSQRPTNVDASTVLIYRDVSSSSNFLVQTRVIRARGRAFPACEGGRSPR
jgi:hypothetical protein